MKFRFFASAIAALGLVAVSSTANAATAVTYATFDHYQVALPTNEELITQLEGGPGLVNVTFLKTGYALSGTGVLFTGSQGGVSLAPAFSATFRDASQYLSLMGERPYC